jgi:NAD(P)-dependent dehydrogenase (short-subunit alcohol dehydrogenase family)
MEQTRTAPVMHRFDGRRAFVLGGGQQSYGQTAPSAGIGSAISRALAAEGAHVAVADVDAGAAASTVATITAEGGWASPVIGDATDPDGPERMVTQAATVLGDGLDLLVANVGLVGPDWSVLDASSWDRVFALNVRAHYLTGMAALGVMPEGGAIVLVSSVVARMVVHGAAAYHASKAALDGLCIWMAKHAAGQGVRVNVVVAGIIDTPLGRAARSAQEGQPPTVPLGRMGTAWDVADAVTFLLSDASSYVTGQELVVDGGLLALR